MSELNGSVDKLAAAFRDVVGDAVSQSIKPIEKRLETVEKDVSMLKNDMATIKGDTKQILEIVTGGRP